MFEAAVIALIFVSACATFAVYNYLSIKGKTAFWPWHIAQWLSVILFMAAAFLFGRWSQGFNFHTFGTIVAFAALGIPVYVFTLHALLKRHRETIRFEEDFWKF